MMVGKKGRSGRKNNADTQEMVDKLRAAFGSDQPLPGPKDAPADMVQRAKDNARPELKKRAAAKAEQEKRGKKK